MAIFLNAQNFSFLYVRIERTVTNQKYLLFFMFYSSLRKETVFKKTFQAKKMGNVFFNLFYLRYFFYKMAFSVRTCQ